jgi:hypothetical protein
MQWRNNNNKPTTATQQTHTQIEMPHGNHVFQSKTNPIMTDANPATTKETIPDTTAQTQHTANRKHKTAETRDRTGDLQIFSLTLSQLSYRGRWRSNRPTLKRQVARTNAQAQTTTLPGRLELPTLRLTASRSNQLSYGSTRTCNRTHAGIRRNRGKHKRNATTAANATMHIGTINGPVAQWTRHRPTEPGIASSRPAGVMCVRSAKSGAPALLQHTCEPKSTTSAIV